MPRGTTLCSGRHSVTTYLTLACPLRFVRGVVG
jgi:hypothetical protein